MLTVSLQTLQKTSECCIRFIEITGQSLPSEQEYQSTECLLHLHDLPTLQMVTATLLKDKYRGNISRNHGQRISNIILTNFVICIESWVIADCIVTTKNTQLLELAFKSFSSNHALFKHCRCFQCSLCRSRYKIRKNAFFNDLFKQCRCDVICLFNERSRIAFSKKIRSRWKVRENAISKYVNPIMACQRKIS